MKTAPPASQVKGRGRNFSRVRRGSGRSVSEGGARNKKTRIQYLWGVVSPVVSDIMSVLGFTSGQQANWSTAWLPLYQSHWESI